MSEILMLSASRIKTFKQCPRKYYYEYIEKLPKKQWDFFTLGTFVHGVLERFHKEFTDAQCLNNNPSRLMKIAFSQQRDNTKNISNEILQEAYKLLTAYLEKIKEKFNSKVLKTEDSFSVNLTDTIGVRGIVDRLDLDDDGIYHLKDYKTTKDAKYMDQFQLQTYGIYLNEKFQNIDAFRGSYIMLRLDSRPIFYNFNKEDVEKIKKELIEFGEKIKQESKWATKPSRLCEWCDFQKECSRKW